VPWERPAVSGESVGAAAFPEWEAHYFVPRGYAIALMDLRGTRNSSGCEVYGDKQEALDAVAVVDWIASQSWSNGKASARFEQAPVWSCPFRQF
jgi:predicted acyl esterase